MPKYKLTYFDLAGRAEVSRMLFYMAGVEFEDKRINLTTEWPAFKPNTPFGQLPVLEIDDDFVLCQSHAIYRYLGRLFGYVGKTDVDQAKVDNFVECVGDFYEPAVKGIIYNTDPEDKAKNFKRYTTEQLPFFLGRFEAFLGQNKQGSGYFVGDGMTIADMYFIERLISLQVRAGIEADLQPYPRIAALKDKVLKHPKIAAYKNKA